MLVVDASALADYLLGNATGQRVAGFLAEHAAELHVPALCDVEVAAIFRRALNSGELTADRAADGLIDLVDLPLARHGHAALLGRILQLRANFSAYDATYVALAEQLGAALLTADTPLARAVAAHLTVEVIDASSVPS